MTEISLRQARCIIWNLGSGVFCGRREANLAASLGAFVYPESFWPMPVEAWSGFPPVLDAPHLPSLVARLIGLHVIHRRSFSHLWSRLTSPEVSQFLLQVAWTGHPPL